MVMFGQTRKVRVHNISEAEYRDLWALASLTLVELKALWDEYDGSNCPGGYSGEAIHATLNLRGHGDYCTV